MVKRARVTNPGPKNKGVVKKRKPNAISQQTVLIGAAGKFAPKSAEKKNIDKSATLTPTTAIVSPTAATLLNLIPLGTGPSARIGRKVSLTSMTFRYHLQLDSTPGETRIIGVYDKQPNGAFPTASDIFAPANMSALQNLSNSDRFMVIFDEYVLREAGYAYIAGTAQPSYANKIVRKFNPPLQMQYNDVGGGTIADISTGAIYFFVVSLGATANTSLQFVSRFRYTDN